MSRRRWRARPQLSLWAVIAGLVAAGPALGDARPWYLGLPVSQVSLEAPDGGLPRENLEPLLRVGQGASLRSVDVRSDIALLYRAGDFASVEAHAEPWVLFDEDGDPTEAVRLVYRVLPPPRVATLEISGLRGRSRAVALDALAVHPGDPFYEDEALPALTARVREALARDGWPDARITFDAQWDGSNVHLRLSGDSGEPRRYSAVVLTGDVLGDDGECTAARSPCRLSERRIRRILRRHGVVAGRRAALPDLARAREEITETLVDWGWLQARVLIGAFDVDDEQGGHHLTINLESGPRVLVDLDVAGGRRPGREPSRADLDDVLGLYAGDRVTAGTAVEVKERLQAWYDERGYPAADVRVDLKSEGEDTSLTLNVDPGPLHRLRRLDVQGGEAFNAAYLSGALREAAPESLGRRRVSVGGLDSAAESLREFYRGQGFLEARVEVGTMRTLGVRRRGGMLFVSVPVTVEEGPRTTLVALDVVGGGGLESALMSLAREELVDRPYGPARLDELTREVVDRYRADGYLNADARLEVDFERDAHHARARIIVESGQPIRLRSVIIRGNQRTRRRVIEREVALTVGEPITPDGISATRGQLYELGVFSIVSPELVGDDDRARDLLLELKERPNILLETGGGVSTDQGVAVKAKATHRNLGGRAHQLSLLGQGGYGWLGDEWSLDFNGLVGRAAARYTAPNLPRRGQTLVLEALLGEVLQEPTFRLVRSGGSVGVQLRLFDEIETRVGYSAEYRTLQDIDPGALVNGDPWIDALLSEDGESVETPSDARVITGPGVTFLLDARDDPFNPSAGQLATLRVELTDAMVDGPVTVLGTARFEQFLPVGPVVLDLEVLGGLGWARGQGTTLPVEDRFYLGGASTLRGYSLNTVGPANFTGRPDLDFPDQIEPVVEGAGVRAEPAHWVATGGDALAAVRTEVRVPMPVLGLRSLDTTSLVFFTDVGRAGFLDRRVITTSRLLDVDPIVRVGVGAGLRITTPIGPAAIDLGINPAPLRSRGEPRFVPHLSIGEF